MTDAREDATKLVDVAEASRLLSVPTGTIYSWRSRRLITPAVVLGDGTQLYVLSEIAEIAATRRPRKRGA